MARAPTKKKPNLQIVKTKADKAEATTNAKKAAADAKKATKSDKKRFNSPIDEGDKARFLHHLPLVEKGRSAIASATNAIRVIYKTALADGFTKADFDYALDVQTPEKEQATKQRIGRRLLIAKFMGSDLGAQFELFSEPSRVPAEDRAFEEGQSAAMQNKPAKPGYDPSTPQYRSYMKGFHDVSAKLVKGGIKPLDDTPRDSGGGFVPFTEDELASQQALADEANEAAH